MERTPLPLGYLVVSVLCLVFGIIYEMFSHGVWSAHMYMAFLVPLTGGLAQYAAVAVKKRRPSYLERYLYRSGIATITVGSIVLGMLKIYGTTNRLTGIYFLAGAGLTASAAIAFFSKTD